MFKVWVWGIGFGVRDLGCEFGLGFHVEGLGFDVQGLGFML